MIELWIAVALALQADPEEPAAAEPPPMILRGGIPAPQTLSEVPQPRPSIINPATVVQVASADDLARYYPDKASRLEVAGSAKVTCFVSVLGRAIACHVASEEPEGFGFGEATKRVIMEAYRFSPAKRDGVAFETWPISLTIRWRPPE